MFTTEGASFAPLITVDSGAEILWTWADGTTSSLSNPSKNYGSAEQRENRLRVTPWSALRGINIGYDAGDGGSDDIARVQDQSVSAVSGLGLASAASLAGKGWIIETSNGTVSPPPAADTGLARIDFTTSGDSTAMRCDFSVGSTAVWHWSDGSVSPAVSGEAASKSGLGDGAHAHYLEISNGAALARFGSAESGSGRLTSISALDGAPHLAILWAFGEGGLSSVGRHSASRIREFHLMGTALDAADMDQLFADAAASGILVGIVFCPCPGTSASDSDRALLAERGWTLQY